MISAGARTQSHTCLDWYVSTIGRLRTIPFESLLETMDNSLSKEIHFSNIHCPSLSTDRNSWSCFRFLIILVPFPSYPPLAAFAIKGNPQSAGRSISVDFFNGIANQSGQGISRLFNSSLWVILLIKGLIDWSLGTKETPLFSRESKLEISTHSFSKVIKRVFSARSFVPTGFVGSCKTSWFVFLAAGSVLAAVWTTTSTFLFFPASIKSIASCPPPTTPII